MSQESAGQSAGHPETASVPPHVDELTETEKTRRRRRYLLGRFLRGGRRYWGREGGRLAWVLTGILLVILLLNLGTSLGMNVWNRVFFDALEKKQSATVFWLALGYFPLLAVSVAVGIALVYTRMTVQRRWRAWLNSHLLDRWLYRGRYYQLNLLRGDHQNPEYRVADDVRVATDSPVDFVTGLISAVLSALTFIVVLWTIGGSLSFEVGGGTHVTIPGFLVIAAVLYAVLASAAMVLIGRR